MKELPKSLSLKTTRIKFLPCALTANIKPPFAFSIYATRRSFPRLRESQARQF